MTHNFHSAGSGHDLCSGLVFCLVFFGHDSHKNTPRECFKFTFACCGMIVGEAIFKTQGGWVPKPRRWLNRPTRLGFWITLVSPCVAPVSGTEHLSIPNWRCGKVWNHDRVQSESWNTWKIGSRCLATEPQKKFYDSMLRLHVVLPSGRSESCSLPKSSKVEDRKIFTRRSLGQVFSKLLAVVSREIPWTWQLQGWPSPWDGMRLLPL